MAQYGAINIGALLTASGVSVAGTADIEVRRESDGALASIYSDEAGTTPIAQPGSQTDASGRAKFYTPGTNHGLKITITKGAESHIWRNVPIGTAGQRDCTDFGASLMNAADAPTARAALGLTAHDIYLHSILGPL